METPCCSVTGAASWVQVAIAKLMSADAAPSAPMLGLLVLLGIVRHVGLLQRDVEGGVLRGSQLQVQVDGQPGLRHGLRKAGNWKDDFQQLRGFS